MLKKKYLMQQQIKRQVTLVNLYFKYTLTFTNMPIVLCIYTYRGKHTHIHVHFTILPICDVVYTCIMIYVCDVVTVRSNHYPRPLPSLPRNTTVSLYRHGFTVIQCTRSCTNILTPTKGYLIFTEYSISFKVDQPNQTRQH